MFAWRVRLFRARKLLCYRRGFYVYRNIYPRNKYLNYESQLDRLYIFSREIDSVNATQRNNHFTIIANFIETIETGRYSKDKNTGYWDYV